MTTGQLQVVSTAWQEPLFDDAGQDTKSGFYFPLNLFLLIELHEDTVH